MQLQWLHGDAALSNSCPHDKLFIRDFASASQDVDVKPTAAELVSLTAHNQSLSSRHGEEEFSFGRRQIWSDVHDSCSQSPSKDWSFPLSGQHQTAGELVSPVNQHSGVAARTASDTFSRHFATDQGHHTSRPSFFQQQQSFQTSRNGWQYPSASSLPSYNFVPQSGFESSGTVSANCPPGFSQDVRSKFGRLSSAELAVPMPAQCHYLQNPDGSSSHTVYSASNVTTALPHRTGTSHNQGMLGYHRRRHHHHHHHQPYSQYQQQHRPEQQQPQIPISPSSQCPEVKVVQLELSGGGGDPGDVASSEFASEADVAAERLPGALKLINDLQRCNTRLRDSVDQLRCYADELLQQWPTHEKARSDDGTSLECDDDVAVTRQMIVMACQLCDQALFVLVEWARHAHFFRQLPVSSFPLYYTQWAIISGPLGFYRHNSGNRPAISKLKSVSSYLR